MIFSIWETQKHKDFFDETKPGPDYYPFSQLNKTHDQQNFSNYSNFKQNFQTEDNNKTSEPIFKKTKNSVTEDGQGNISIKMSKIVSCGNNSYVQPASKKSANKKKKQK